MVHQVLRSVGVAVTAVVVGAGGVAVTAPAAAIAGGSAVPDGGFRFTVRLDIGDVVSCSGALVDSQWVLTSSACLTRNGSPVTGGKPPASTRAVIDRVDLTSTAGRVVDVVEVVKHPSRNVTLALLGRRVTGVPTIPLAASAPVVGEGLRITGYGRTAVEWAPDRMQSALFTVDAVDDGSISVLGAVPDRPVTCRGDAGGPVFREGSQGPELVAVSDSSWQRGCFGETEAGDGTAAGDGTVGERADVVADWVRETTTAPRSEDLGLSIAATPSPSSGNRFTGLLRDPRDGAIYLVVNGSRYHLNPTEYAALGSPAAPDVSAAEISRHSEPVPTGSVLIRDYTDGAIYLVVNGSRYHLNPTEYAALGSPAFVSVPPGFVARITGTVPSGMVYVRDYTDGAIYLVVNGSRYHLNPTEYAALGSPAFVSVPRGLVALIGEVPAEGTNLRSLDTGNVYTIRSGRPHFVSARAWSELSDRSYSEVPQGYLDALLAR